jgi:hypothetical protein
MTHLRFGGRRDKLLGDNLAEGLENLLPLVGGKSVPQAFQRHHYGRSRLGGEPLGCDPRMAFLLEVQGKLDATPQAPKERLPSLLDILQMIHIAY